MKIQIILGSTREGRKGEIIANWVLNTIKKQTKHTVEILDLRTYQLPFYDEPTLASMITKYKHKEAQVWADKVGEGDAYIIITPEYNRGYPAVLKNALDYVYKEWNNKPVAFISYGGGASGARAVEQLRQVVIELQMIPIQNSMHFQLRRNPFDANGKLQDMVYDDQLEKLFNRLTEYALLFNTFRKNSLNS